MTDENEQAGTPDEARDERAATGFMDATIALSDLGAKFVAALHPMKPAQELPPDSMWAPVEAVHRSVGERVARQAEAVKARAAASAIDNAREAVEYGQQHGIRVPQHIIERARMGQDG